MMAVKFDELRIAVIGGGIGGLGVALALQQIGCKRVTVFDKDATFDFRAQGYGLTIQQASFSLFHADTL